MTSKLNDNCNKQQSHNYSEFIDNLKYRTCYNYLIASFILTDMVAARYYYLMENHYSKENDGELPHVISGMCHLQLM